MFPSFTGSARPRRQVNLSGRNNNPFAVLSGPRSSSSPSSAHSAIAQAQQERILRQQERERPPAAIRIQKTWRGYKQRKDAANYWRQDWDHREGWDRVDMLNFIEENSSWALSPATSYSSDADCLISLKLLARFADSKDEGDTLRVVYFSSKFLQSLSPQPNVLVDAWRLPLSRLARLSVAMLNSGLGSPLGLEIYETLLAFLRYVSASIPKLFALICEEEFRVLAAIAVDPRYKNKDLIKYTILGSLQQETPKAEMVYEAFVTQLLTVADIPMIFGGLEDFASALAYEMLASAMEMVLSPLSGRPITDLKSRESLLWLLSYFIHFRRYCFSKRKNRDLPDAQYVKVASKLISFLADDIGNRIDVSFSDLTDGNVSRSNPHHISPLPPFVRSEILSLISQENVSSLLANMNTVTISADSAPSPSSDASALASYALTLLRAFPWRRDEIRLWLYRGSASGRSPAVGKKKPLPAIKYFFQAASATSVYERISKNPHETVEMLRPDKTQNGSSIPTPSAESTNQQWRVILLFLELYTFVLMVMDDEEFLSGTLESNEQWSWTRQSALTLDQVKNLTGFLKNLAFSMYWSSTEIAGVEAVEAKTSLADYFGGPRPVRMDKPQEEPQPKSADLSIAGISGMTLTYLKGMVTGVLRMVYERDSRRKFMPRDHWLMTKYFEMDRFISAVVSEEEEKYKIQDSYGADGEDLKVDDDADIDDIDGENEAEIRNLVGTQHAQQIRNAQKLQKKQHKAARRKYLESVTPRLEILQNMPFFIPFPTRVQIFRQFVALDQLRRRGTADPDEWRFAVMNSSNGNDIGKHRAKVRRKNIFLDAYTQFYQLGDGLKEPIQIRFVDEFDTVEEGIDGGGVTKEFLTSVTNEAFGASNGLDDLFIENDQHLLYPNPAAIDEIKVTLQQALYKEGSPKWNETIRDLLRRYEFLGRIVGKCLYEGILVDIHFAPFFLLKWALTGGSGSATKESGYRANLNDLRDLDEGLYQGLLQLKNYPGNVEDFSLNFAVTDTIRTSPTEAKQVTRELRPSGTSISVTNENRLVYISFMARHRLQIQPHQQTSAFLKGLGAIISPSWLSMFNQSELQTLVGGSSSEVSVSDLRANTQYGGIYAIGDDGIEHPSVQLFWKVMQNLDDADRKKVLKFVTSTPRAPLLGFGNLNPRFSIRDSGSDQTRLPSTSTCVNLLKLPIYRDEKTLRERLLYSVNSGAGFNLS